MATEHLPPSDEKQAQLDPSTSSDTSSTSTPPISSWAIRAYLGLRAKMSQTPFSYLIIFLCVQVWRLFQQKRNVDAMAREARQSFAEDCRSIEQSVVSLQYFPIYAALGASRALATAVNKTIQELASLIGTFVEGALATIRLAIEILTGNWRCLLLQLASSSFPPLSGIGNGAVTVMDTATNTLIDLLSGPFTVLGSKAQDRLLARNITIDERTLNPTGRIKPIEFCTELVNKISLDFITDLLNNIYNIGLYCVGALIVIVFLWNLYSTRRGHRSWEKNVKRIKDQLHLWYTIHPPKELSVVSQPIKQEHPESTQPSTEDPSKQHITIGDTQAPIEEVAARLARLCTNPLLFGPVEYLLFRYASKHPNRQARILWFLEYVSQRPAVVCFKIGVMGLIMAQLQLYALRRVREGAFDDVLRDSAAVLANVATLVSRMSNGTAEAMAESINQAVLIVESDINFEVMIELRNATQTVSRGLTTVQSTIEAAIHSAFGQHLLGGMAVASIQCLLLNKLERVQRGIAAIERHLVVDFPELDPKIFMVDPSKIETHVNEAIDAMLGPPPGTNSTTPQDPNNSPLARKVRAAAIIPTVQW
ncbi:plasma membrane fusion protein prm1 [Actinomortierella ambigua]|nr:plasma membrane fusion protein prm1 [Actinomortierella ambigua]